MHEFQSIRNGKRERNLIRQLLVATKSISAKAVLSGCQLSLMMTVVMSANTIDENNNYRAKQ